jgi:cytochrome P450
MIRGMGPRAALVLRFGRIHIAEETAMSSQAQKCPITGGNGLEAVTADGTFDAATFAQRFNQFSPEYGLHFRDIYRYMRGRCPVAHTDEVGGLWVVTRYADIERVAGDDEVFSSLYGVLPSVNPVPAGGGSPPVPRRTGPLAAYPPGPNGEAPHLSILPIELDPPLHDLYRKAIEPLFSSTAIAELEPWLLALANQLIDAIIEKGEGDFCRDLSAPFASMLTMKFLGLPLEDWSDYAWFTQSSHGGTSNVRPRTKDLSERELRERVAGEVVRQRTRPVIRGVIAYLLDVTVDGRKLDSWEIEAYVWLMIGNVDGTQACMGSGFVWLSRNPEQRKRLGETPHLIPSAVEEFLRVFSPRQAFSRTVMHDIELAGKSLKSGDHVLLCWVSGNLDEREFENPEKVDIDRTNKRHMAFGLGAHSCMAVDLIRLEFRILFEQVLSRMRDFRLKEVGLRPSPNPAIVAGYQYVPFNFMPGNKVGGPRIADDGGKPPGG